MKNTQRLSASTSMDKALVALILIGAAGAVVLRSYEVPVACALAAWIHVQGYSYRWWLYPLLILAALPVAFWSGLWTGMLGHNVDLPGVSGLLLPAAVVGVIIYRETRGREGATAPGSTDPFFPYVEEMLRDSGVDGDKIRLTRESVDGVGPVSLLPLSAVEQALKVFQASGNSAEADQLSTEIAQRHQAITASGFDSVLLAALMKHYGMRPVSSPIVLQPGEQAHLTEPAKLARMQTSSKFVGHSSGVSIPLGHGFRYRVGSFKGHRVSEQKLTVIDVGQVVVTSDRLVFAGSRKTVAVKLTKVVNMNCYQDGLEVFHDGKEDGDFFACAQPGLVMFYIDAQLGQTAT